MSDGWEALEQLVILTQAWADEGDGETLTIPVLEEVAGIRDCCRRIGVPCPSFQPNYDGGLGLVWDTGGTWVLWEIAPDGTRVRVPHHGRAVPGGHVVDDVGDLADCLRLGLGISSTGWVLPARSTSAPSGFDAPAPINIGYSLPLMPVQWIVCTTPEVEAIVRVQDPSAYMIDPRRR